ncbi:MAG: methylaspartate mutase [Catenulispora sp.]|nr:methylaspartate mutase [Catenulispora sp.]
MSGSDFAGAVRRAHAAGRLVVQPRMGLGDPALMRAGLVATKAAAARTVGTITLDSYTRIGDLESAERAVRGGMDLNGYPIVTHGARATRRMLDGVADADFPVQVRHGSARPARIVEAMCRAGLSATEGGPVSYCLPYGRTRLDVALHDWTRACRILASNRPDGATPHLETFGGCLMGQLCPPSLLVAVSVLEALYFRSMGITSVSVSYAQQTNEEQDREAIAALRGLCAELLPDVDWHVVVYAYMGVYPRTAGGARELLAQAARLAVDSGAERLIVKTVAEAHRLPTIAENIEALEFADGVAAGRPKPAGRAAGHRDSEVYQEAHALVEAVLNLAPEPGRALVTAVQRGLLDVPFCLHPENAGRARSFIDADGRLRWAEVGAMPLRGAVVRGGIKALTASGLVQALSHMQRTYDAAALERSRRGAALGMSS